MADGWIKIYYKIKEWEWYGDPNMVAFWIHLLVSANWKEKKWRGKTIKRGQLLTSRSRLADETGLSEQQTRRCLSNLQESGEITYETTNKNTLITICKYENYQCEEPIRQPANQPTTNQQTTNGQPTNNQQTTTTKESNNINKLKKEIKKDGGYNAPPREMGLEAYGILHNVMLSAQQHRTLSETFGQSETDTAIDELSCKLADGTFDSRNHYATLHYWLSYRINSGTVKPSTPQQDPYYAEKQVWAAFSEKDKQEYLQAHGGKHPWEE